MMNNVYEGYFIQISIEYLLCTRNSSRYLDYTNEKDPCSFDVCLLGGNESVAGDGQTIVVRTIKGYCIVIL